MTSSRIHRGCSARRRPARYRRPGVRAARAAAVEAARGNTEARETLEPRLDQLAADPDTATLAAALQNITDGGEPATPLPDLDRDQAAILEEIRRRLTQPHP